MKKNSFYSRIRSPFYRRFFFSVLVLFVMVPFQSGAEVIRSAISSDGVTFTIEPGLRTTGIYVDPYILVAEQGNWVGLFSTSPAPSVLPQVIYVGTSVDGLTWSMENRPIITVPGANALDPTAVPLDDGSYRVYYSATPGNNPFGNFFLKSGILKPKSNSKNDEDVEIEVSGSKWSFVEDGVDLGILGVSPEAILLENGDVRLYVTDIGMKVYRSGDGVTFVQEPAILPSGSDSTLIRLDDNTYRMYYVDRGQGTEVIWTATSADGLNWQTESSTGIENITKSQAWGVPDSIELPDGRIRLYWVDR